MSNCFDITHLTKEYPSFLLQHISFSLPQGKVMGLIGPNGSGKTTIIKCLLNLTDYEEGAIHFNGVDSKKCLSTQKLNIGYVAAENYFSDTWCARDINSIMSFSYPTWDSKTFRSYLERFGIAEQLLIKNYSTGMRTRLMIASVLSRKNDLLILDEPTSGLDPKMRYEFLKLLKEYSINNNSSVLYSSHITTDLENIADYITFVYGGRLVFSSSMVDALQSYYCISTHNRYDFPLIKQVCHDLHENETGAVGLVSKDCLEKLDHNVLRPLTIRPASLEDILVLYNE